MKRYLIVLTAVATMTGAHAADPLRVYIRGGKKSHGPGAHEHEKFLNDWVPLLKERGMEADGGMDLPTDEQLAKTDVVIFHAQEGGTIPPSRWGSFDEYLKRGGGVVVLHAAAVSLQPDHWKTVTGGTWRQGATKWKEGPMDLYYVENQRITDQHPITMGASNFHLDDEIYYDMDLSPDVRVLATSYTPNVKEGRKPAEDGKVNIYDIQPQMWTYERTVEGGSQPYRAFVSIPGHLYVTFARPNYRAILMRGIAWAGKRADVNEFVKPEELSALTYPEGGPQKPEVTREHLEVHPDFNLTLVAAEPLITKPMNFDWAPDGSMWVAETPEYPNGRRGMRPDYRGKEWKDHGGIDPEPGRQDRPGRDKISRLVDTDGDGVMDKKEVFYEGLDLVTGLVFYKDGVIVTQAPDILWLRDTDHDGKADKIEKLYGNLGTSDTHAVINNPRWGWDGWIYATHGYSASGNVVNAKGEKMDNIGSGVVRFKPDGSKIEQYSSKGGNTWGLQVTADNRVMWTQPTSGTILEHVVLPEYALSRGKWGNTPSFNVVIGSPKTWPAMSWDQMAYRQIDFVGSFTATAGCAIYDGGSWPEEYNGDYFTTEPTINIVHHERLTPKGSSYEGNKLPGREETEFIRSTDMWWRPIEARVGPDGAVYIGDFYNQAVIHNDTRGPDHNNVNAAVRPDRDHYFGRIWRLDHKQAKKLPVPDLSKADPAALVQALDNPNRSVRMTASRLLVERNSLESLKGVAKPATREGRIGGMWTAHRLLAGSGSSDWITSLAADPDPAIRRNAAAIAEDRNLATTTASGDPVRLPALVSDPDATVRVSALLSIAALPVVDAELANAIIAAWPLFSDDYQKSAAVGALAGNRAAAIAAVLESGKADLAPLASLLVQGIAEKDDAAAASALVISLAAQPASADSVKSGILDTLSKSMKATPEMTPELSTALTKLLGSGVSASVLPLAAQWDKAGALKGAMDSLIADLFGKLTKGSDDERFAAGQSLISLRSANAEALPAVLKVLTGDASPMLKARLITALSETGDAAVGEGIATAFASLPAEAQTVAFNVMLKRPEWALAFLDAVKAKTVDPAVLGPANAFRLRTHPNKRVAGRAGQMLDELMPGAKAKAEIIAKLAPEVEKKGNMEQGKLIFAATCATCHKFGDAGADVAPNLTGMGAHGAGELLAAIVDPNAEVDPSFTAWNIETNDGQVYAGVIARENPSSLFLKFQGGEKEIRTADIKSRINTGRSLMPEGFDGLGPEILRDIITYMQAADGGGKYRTLDLRNAFTTTTALGLYMSQDIKDQSLDFRKTGTVPVEGIPFNVVAPEKSPNNIIVLKGGPDGTYCSTMPRKVEIQAGGFKANRLHFLGGVTGWGYQPGADKSDVLKITVHTTAGQRETIMCQNGVEFSDYINRIDVPGSKFIGGLVKDHQIRWFTKALSGPVEIERITLESVGGSAAPTVVAITAELAEGESAAVKTEPASPAGDAIQWGQGTKVLVVGGGSSHNFQKFFNEADLATLTAAGGVTCHYTEDVAVTAKELPGADVLVLSTNQGSFASFAFRKALEDHANAGKGIVFIHPGMWYNMREWPEFNKVYIGGGARGHDHIQEFEVKSTGIQHPVMKGIPDTFKITDELYYAIPDPEGTPIEVLATATSPISGKTFPSIYVVKHPKTRIVCIAPGHDERVHSLDVYQKLLTNAVKWVSEKK